MELDISSFWAFMLCNVMEMPRLVVDRLVSGSLRQIKMEGKMKHSIVIYKRNRKSNAFFIDTRYDLDETDICNSEIEKHKQLVTEDELKKYEYTAEIEETTHN